MSVVGGLLLMLFTVGIVKGYDNFKRAKAELDAVHCPKGNKEYVDAMIKCQSNMLLLITSVFASCVLLGLEPFTLPVVKFTGMFLIFWLVIYLIAKTLIVNKSIKTWN